MTNEKLNQQELADRLVPEVNAECKMIWNDSTGFCEKVTMKFSGAEYYVVERNNATEVAIRKTEISHFEPLQTEADKQRESQIELMAKHLCPSNQGSWMHYLKDAEFLIDSGWANLQPNQFVANELTDDWISSFTWRYSASQSGSEQIRNLINKVIAEMKKV